MVLGNRGAKEAVGSASRNDQGVNLARVRLAAEMCNGRYQRGESLRLSEIAARYHLDSDMVLKTFAEFQTLGMVTLSGTASAIVQSGSPRDMQEAYEIRAALEEIAGRAAAPTLKDNTTALQQELDGMRQAFRSLDLDSFTEHDVAFHRTIVQASQNRILLHMWDSLALDLRIRGAVEKVAKDIPEVIDSHQPIVDALGRGQGREAGLLLRNHVETILEFLKRTESDSTGMRSAMRLDLENAKDVQKAFFPPTLAIPGLCCKTFYKPVQSIGGDYYDFLQLWGDRWGIAIGDVSGKGIGAALLMASLQASLRSQALHAHSDLAALIGDVDRLVYAASPDHLF